ncbi:MAG: hypothetical protein PHU25_03215 [Deltaproteobacteria bacterium]|nr:hypothetical protein [Deltaproteobacteria bacterium]
MRVKPTRKWLPILAAVTLFTAYAVPALATEARKAALVDNPMVTDDTDIVYFPGVLTTYTNMVFLDVMPDIDAVNGDAGLIVGKNVAFGFWVHRDARWHDIADTADTFAIQGMPEVYDLFDLFFAMKNGFGLRLSMSAGLDTRNVDKPDDTGGAAVVTELQPGYSLDTGSYHGDFGVGLSLPYYEIANAGDTQYKTGWLPSFSLHHRSIILPQADMAWVADVLLTRRAYSVETKGSGGVSGDVGRWETALVIGPRLRLPESLTLWVGVRLGLENLSGTLDDKDIPALTAVSFPGVMASAEITLVDILHLRAGANYDVFWTVADDSDGDTQQRGMGQRFRWSTGIGVSPKSFQIDATISDNLYFNGPQMIGGNNPGFLGMISAAYNW